MGEKLKIKSWADIRQEEGKYVFDVKDFEVVGRGITLDNAFVNAKIALLRKIMDKLDAGELPVGGVARHYGDVLGGIWLEVEVNNVE